MFVGKRQMCIRDRSEIEEVVKAIEVEQEAEAERRRTRLAATASAAASMSGGNA